MADDRDDVTPVTVLRPLLSDAIRDGLAERGWTVPKARTGEPAAPDGLVEKPLELRWRIGIDGMRHGGARVEGAGHLRDPRVVDVLADFPADTMPNSPANARTGFRVYFNLADTVPAELLRGTDSPRFEDGWWELRHERDVEPCIRDYLAMIDGPLADWIRERRTPSLVLDRFEDPDVPVGPNGFVYRTLATLAVLEGRPDLARSVIGRFTRAITDSPERMAAFEVALAERFADYGSPQRTVQGATA